MPHALGGLRVLDLTTGPVGGIATMVLGDVGADVVKVEPPGGDRFRSLAASPLWLRGKRSVVLDLNTDRGRADLHRLVATADVLVVSGPPSRARRWGVDAEAAALLRPDLVHCSITGWGSTGPFAGLPGYDGAVAARSGRMLAFERQLRRGGPVFSAVPVSHHVAAMGAVQGIAAALVARARHGGPQRVETSLLQSLLPFDLVELLIVEMAERQGIEAPNITAAGGDLPTLNYHPVMAADGVWIQCGNLLEHLLLAFLDAIDLLGDLLADDRFIDPPALWGPEAVEVARDKILTRVQERTAAEWMAIFHANGNVAAEPFLTTAAGLDHADLVANGDVVTVEDPARGPVRMAGRLAEFTDTPAVIDRPAPTVGQHSAEVLAEAAAAVVDVPASTVPGSGSSRGEPLAGITVVEFATIIAAPLSTSMLADLGARVIRVEVPEGDPYRHLVAAGTVAAKTTAGKESICLDLKTPEGRAIARQLVAGADVLVHNYRPGVAERLGLGEAELRAEYPRLIWVSIAGYGRHSPSANRPATHPCAGAAMGGAAFQSGVALDTPCPTLPDVREISRQLIRANESNPDPNTSVVAAAATLLALVARERHGIGQAVYVNMLAANLYANADDAVAYAGKAARRRPDPALHGLGPGYRLHRTAGDGWLFLAVTSDAERARAAAVLGVSPDTLTDTGADSLDGAGEALAAVFATRSAAEWEAAFTAVGVAGVRADVATPGKAFAHDPLFLDNGFTPECTHTRFGTHRRWGPIVRVGGGRAAYGPGVLAGEHTDAVLAELGYDGATIADLRARRIVASEPVS